MADTLKDIVLKLKQDTSGITINPVLDAFNLDECEELQAEYTSDDFIKSKINTCIKFLKKCTVHFSGNYKSAYDEYNEAITYLQLKRRYRIERIPEGAQKSPDFHLVNDPPNTFDIYIELKALSFLDGNANYSSAQQSGIESNISIEDQLNQGKSIAFGTSEISPFLKNNKIPTWTGLIEMFIDKITNNIKKGQFEMGDTVLIVDLKQLLIGGHWDENSISIYQNGQMKEMVSGVLWHIAFGQQGFQILQPIEFEGKSNIDTPLNRNGILVDHPYIKGLIFCAYENFQIRKLAGFIRSKDEDSQVFTFISDLCDFYNDENNSEAWRILQS